MVSVSGVSRILNGVPVSCVAGEADPLLEADMPGSCTTRHVESSPIRSRAVFMAWNQSSSSSVRTLPERCMTSYWRNFDLDFSLLSSTSIREGLSVVICLGGIFD